MGGGQGLTEGSAAVGNDKGGRCARGTVGGYFQGADGFRRYADEEESVGCVDGLEVDRGGGVRGDDGERGGCCGGGGGGGGGRCG